jgi:hypothetical protein
MLAVVNSWSFAVNRVHDSKTPKPKNDRDVVLRRSRPPGMAAEESSWSFAVNEVHDSETPSHETAWMQFHGSARDRSGTKNPT